MTDWQPIETAPKDGTLILGHGPYGWMDDAKSTEVGFAVIAWNEVLFLQGKGRSDAWCLVGANPYIDLMEPTHWMPLPDPPKED